MKDEHDTETARAALELAAFLDLVDEVVNVITDEKIDLGYSAILMRVKIEEFLRLYS